MYVESKLRKWKNDVNENVWNARMQTPNPKFQDRVMKAD
jgi:hypothetical protein